jgi:hypothetical protein
MNVAQPGDETRVPDVERGNEALPSIPTNEHRFEEQPQVRVERLSAPESVVHEQPVAVPVQAPSPSVAPSVAPVAVQAEPHPVTTEPKNP